MKASVIISFYNKIDFLKLLLAGFERQTEKDFEVVISDDGSKKEVVAELQEVIKKSPLHIVHNWHEDNGWRKNTILNKSVVLAQSNYLIFVDGDCVPHRSFVSDHLRASVPNTIVAGRRVNLGKTFCLTLTAEKVRNGLLENLFKVIKENHKEGSHLEKAVRNPFTFLNPFFDSYSHGLLGCNFSMFKDDLLSINGFDERYLYPCVGEDTDIEKRFLMKNGMIKRIKQAAIQYHLWHKLLSREDQPKNMEILNATIAQKITFTPYGIARK